MEYGIFVYLNTSTTFSFSCSFSFFSLIFSLALVLSFIFSSIFSLFFFGKTLDITGFLLVELLWSISFKREST